MAGSGPEPGVIIIFIFILVLCAVGPVKPWIFITCFGPWGLEPQAEVGDHLRHPEGVHVNMPAKRRLVKASKADYRD